MSEGQSDQDDDIRHMFTDSESDGDYVMSDGWEETIDDSLQLSRRKRRDPREEELDPETQDVIREAHHAFSQGDHQVAIRLLEGVIAARPATYVAYNLLASIYDDLDDPAKALTAKFLTTHVTPNNKDDWIELAQRSYELGQVSQAAVFYQSASRLSRDDWELLLQRAHIHGELKETGRAISLLNRIKKKHFSRLDENAKAQVMLALARVYKQEGRVSEAKDMYMGIYNQSLFPDRHGEPELTLNWQNLNVLCELLVEQHAYAEVIRVLKSGARWILNRGHEDFWKKVTDDSEFDNRRFDLELTDENDNKIVLGPAAQYELPIDIRIWLLIARLKQINHVPTALEDARIHLALLRQCSAETYGDLYNRAGEALSNAKLFREALDIYSTLTEVPLESPTEYINLQIHVAKCHMELGRMKDAEVLYEYVLTRDENNTEALVALAEICQATMRPSRATMFFDRAQRAKKKASEERQSKSQEPDLQGEFQPLIHQPTKTVAPGAQTRLSAAEKAQLEKSMQGKADKHYQYLERFATGLEKDNIVAAREWLDNAGELLQMFSSNRKFFPTDRNKVFRQPMHKKSLDDRMETLQDIAREDQVSAADGDESSGSAVSGYKFRGKTFDFWFNLFMRAALARAKYEAVEGAYELVRTASGSNIFRAELGQEQTMSLVMLSCAWQAGDTATISDTLRHMYMDRQFHNDIIRLYGALFSSGKSAMGSFGSSNNQKFFLRQIKAVDSVVQQKRISGAARVVSDGGIEIEKENPLLFVLYAHIMLMGPSYVPALTYLMRALEYLPNDPVVLLTLGVVYVQRAIQRVTSDRHLQILQGLSYMQDYQATRQESNAEKQEADYNMGRYFHGLGLFSLARTFYEKVLGYKGVDEEYCLSREAAYNLHLISAMSGNMQESRKLVDSYLVI